MKSLHDFEWAWSTHLRVFNPMLLKEGLEFVTNYTGQWFVTHSRPCQATGKDLHLNKVPSEPWYTWSDNIVDWIQQVLAFAAGASAWGILNM